MTTPNENNLREGLLKLSGLSAIESKILKVKRELDEIPQHLNELETKLAQLEAQFTAKKTALEESEKNYRLKEGELVDSKEKIKVKETKLYEIKTTKEYQAAIKEIAVTKKQNQDNENQILTLMGQIETLKGELGPLEEEIGVLKGKAETEKGRIESDLSELHRQLGEQAALKQQLFISLDANLVARYERVLHQRQPAVAAVRGGTCEECNIHLPPQLFIELQKYLSVISCPSCNRILFIPAE
ncbi:MAG: C4-type zinc ribbon domain-containing protein [bacterium]